MTRQITIEEVKKHKRKSSVWMIIHNDVYDVTSFLEEHPGGEESLLEFAGKDGTQVFEDVNHSEDARQLMQKFKIGTLPPEQQNKQTETCRPEHVKTDSKKNNFEPKAERRLTAIVVPAECSIPPPHCRPRGYPCGGLNYKWAILVLAGVIILGVVWKKHLAR